ncbi:MAG: response regulator [Defluviitaleaceae bacterium]|nr:response regulator [Defluviitaleaceae bacterium]
MYRIFFVDDEPLVLESFMSRAIFLECGFVNIGHCTNSLEAVKAITEAQPEIVFSDLKMPGLNGIELMEKLRESGYIGEFVIVSAYSEFQQVRQFFTMDGFDYLTKPVSEHDLQDLLEKLGRKLAANQEHEKNETTSPELNMITLYLRKHLADKHTLESIGSKFNMKPNFICNLFSRHMETTCTAYLTNIRMEAAALLLKTSTKPVKEIAIACGYRDYFYFCRVFRSIYSCTPTDYRRSAQ